MARKKGTMRNVQFILELYIWFDMLERKNGNIYKFMVIWLGCGNNHNILIVDNDDGISGKYVLSCR